MYSRNSFKSNKRQQKDGNLYSGPKSYATEKDFLTNFIGTFSILILCRYTSMIDHGFLEEVRKNVRHTNKNCVHHF